MNRSRKNAIKELHYIIEEMKGVILNNPPRTHDEQMELMQKISGISHKRYSYLPPHRDILTNMFRERSSAMRITKDNLNKIKSGDKLIFYRYGGVLSAQKGNVFTFSNWCNPEQVQHPGKNYWQCKELLDMGNTNHNFPISAVEIFDESVHVEFVMMDADEIRESIKEFIDNYGE